MTLSPAPVTRGVGPGGKSALMRAPLVTCLSRTACRATWSDSRAWREREEFLLQTLTPHLESHRRDLIKRCVCWSEERDGPRLGEELHQAGGPQEGDQGGELGVEHDQVEDRAERRAGAQGGGRDEAGRVEQGRMVVVRDQQVVLGHLVVNIVMGLVVNHFMDRQVRHQLVVRLVMDHLNTEMSTIDHNIGISHILTCNL